MIIKTVSLIRLLLAGACVALVATQLSAADSPREHLSLDANWKFHLGDDWPDALHLENSGTGSGPASEQFADSYWRAVNLPHDWAVELPFDRTADGSHGFKALGRNFPTNSIAWYRRTFELPKRGRRQTHLADVRRRVPRRDGVGQRLVRETSRGRLLSVPRGHHGRGAFRRHEHHRRARGRDENPRAGFTKARASTATSGWTRPRRWPSRRTGFLSIREFKNNVPARQSGNHTSKSACSTHSPTPRKRR